MPRAPRMKCAYAAPDAPKIKKARAAPVKLTPEEKEQKKTLAKARAAGRERKKEWEAALKPWEPRADSSRGLVFPPGTKAQFKSDAKKAFGLTDKEVASVPYMGFSGSFKTIYRLTDCKALADRKRAALGIDTFDYPARTIIERTQPPKGNPLWGVSLANLLGEPDHTLTVQGTSLKSLSGRREGMFGPYGR